MTDCVRSASKATNVSSMSVHCNTNKAITEPIIEPPRTTKV